MKKLLEILKKYYNLFINNENNIRVKVSTSSFLSGILLFGMLMLKDISNKSFYVKTMEFASAIYFVVWLITSINPDARFNVLKELSKCIFFIFSIIFSLDFWYSVISINFNPSPLKFLIAILFFSILTMWCMYYVLSIFSIIVLTIKSKFSNLKYRLYGDKKESSLPKRVLENVTAFLVALGGLAVSIVTIINAISSIYTPLK